MKDGDDTGDVLAAVSGRSVITSRHAGHVYASVSPRAWTCQSPSTGLSWPQPGQKRTLFRPGARVADDDWRVWGGMHYIIRVGTYINMTLYGNCW
jgi:hypothetical protein